MDRKLWVKRISFALSLMALGGMVTFIYLKHNPHELPPPGTLVEINGAAARVSLPGDLFDTTDDQFALARAAEIIHVLGAFYHRELDGTEIANLIIRGLTGVDPHTYVLDATAAQIREEETRGEFGGIGAELSSEFKTVNNVKGLRVNNVMDDTPSAHAGMQAGDVITHVDGHPTADMTGAEVLKKIRGDVGTSLTLTLMREGMSGPIEMKIRRAIIKLPIVKSELIKDTGFGYARIATFSAPVSQDLRDAVRKLNIRNGGPLKGLVIDLRRNPGGLLASQTPGKREGVDGLLDEFLVPSRYAQNNERMGTISMESRGEIYPQLSIGGDVDLIDGAPLLVLIDFASASASEIAAGVLQMYGRAVIAGVSRSYGKGTVQTLIPLNSGGVIGLTTAQYLIGPKGCEQPVQGRGVTPDIMLKPNHDEATALANTKFEETLAGALSTSTVSSEGCVYHFEVSSEHKAAAYEMLKALELEPLNH